MSKMQQHYNKIKQIYRGSEYPDTICISYSLRMLTHLGQWRHKEQTRRYWIYFYVMYVGLLVHFGTLVWDLCEIYKDIILFGDSMCVVSGVSLVLFKKMYHNYYSAQFEAIFEQLKRYSADNNNRDTEIRDLQRKYYIEEYILIIFTIILGVTTVAGISMHSLFDSTTPLRAKYPFEVDSTARLVLSSIFQFTMSFYVIESIVFLDGIGGQVMSQMTLHFHVLYLEFQRIRMIEANSQRDHHEFNVDTQGSFHRLIKRHQDLMEFGQQINTLYQPMLMAQLVSSLSMICLTAFEATLTTDNPFLFSKFAIYAMSVFIQILYWCYYGNRVSHMSGTINEALIECNWIPGANSFKKDLMIVMNRAQRPFQFRVYEYFPISYETFIAVLSRSYSLFTLFRTVSD